MKFKKEDLLAGGSSSDKQSKFFPCPVRSSGGQLDGLGFPWIQPLRASFAYKLTPEAGMRWNLFTMTSVRPSCEPRLSSCQHIKHREP